MKEQRESQKKENEKRERKKKKKRGEGGEQGKKKMQHLNHDEQVSIRAPANKDESNRICKEDRNEAEQISGRCHQHQSQPATQVLGISLVSLKSSKSKSSLSSSSSAG